MSDILLLPVFARQSDPPGIVAPEEPPEIRVKKILLNHRPDRYFVGVGGVGLGLGKSLEMFCPCAATRAFPRQLSSAATRGKIFRHKKCRHGAAAHPSLVSDW
jgi:hypothetical protein